jgi:hypothetical protein
MLVGPLASFAECPQCWPGGRPPGTPRRHGLVRRGLFVGLLLRVSGSVKPRAAPEPPGGMLWCAGVCSLACFSGRRFRRNPGAADPGSGRRGGAIAGAAFVRKGAITCTGMYVKAPSRVKGVSASASRTSQRSQWPIACLGYHPRNRPASGYLAGQKDPRPRWGGARTGKSGAPGSARGTCGRPGAGQGWWPPRGPARSRCGLPTAAAAALVARET